MLLAVSPSRSTSTKLMVSPLKLAVGWKVKAPVVITMANSPPTTLVSVSTVSVLVVPS